MFLHQMDHLYGKLEENWSLERGKIDMLNEKPYEYEKAQDLSMINFFQKQMERQIRDPYVS